MPRNRCLLVCVVFSVSYSNLTRFSSGLKQGAGFAALYTMVVVSGKTAAWNVADGFIISILTSDEVRILDCVVFNCFPRALSSSPL